MDNLLRNRSALVGLVLVVLGVIVAALALHSFDHPEGRYGVLAVAAFGLVAVVFAAGGATDVLTRASGAARRASDGEKPTVPGDLPAAGVLLYDELDRMAARIAKSKALDEGLPKLADALRRAASGDRPGALPEAMPERDAISTALEDIATRGQKVRAADSELETRGARIRTLEGELESRNGRVRSLEGEIEMLRSRQSEVIAAPTRGGDDQLRREIEGAADELESGLSTAISGLSEQLGAVDQATRTLREMASGLSELARNVEKLATSAEESSSSILEVSATNQEVAENIANLARSVSQTVASIEQMTASIREVARNVDGLSLTAEETSSSMNEMDVSIDQVQSNANETARLSEEVSQDAERGAEAILKTIGEINRIKETSQEGVSVISNLGSRIEAIGQIVNVIDDVAEQTNLLALNAAIIAAQAGEHGKGFAVVADEIKDLAERAGASTKEITDLIKTIQTESKNAISAVERSATMVDRGVEVSNEAERALKKILESSRKSTNMVRAIARATVEQAKGSKQVTDAMGRIAETVQQIAAATAQQARGSEQIMKSAEQMRMITEHVERSSQEQARGGRQISQAMEAIASSVNQLNESHRGQARSSESVITTAMRIEEISRGSEVQLRRVNSSVDRLRRIARS